MENIIGLKEFRTNLTALVEKIRQGTSFVVFKKTKPLFKVSSLVDEEGWEEVVDFTKIKRGGINIKELLSRL